MWNRYDILYALAVGLAAPVWLLKASARKKVYKAFAQRMGRVSDRDPKRPAVIIHAVSLGEMNATRGLVRRLAELHRGLQFIISTTTDTGYARAQELYGKDPSAVVVRYPLDFSSGIRRFLDALRPDLVVLMELEVWPNFIRHCQKRGIPVLLVNGRITNGSYRNYRLGRGLIRPTFARLTSVCAQDGVYAQRFVDVGARRERVSVTGTMKFDTATIGDRVEGDAALAEALGLAPEALGAAEPSERVWVCGATGPGEELIVLGAYRKLLGKFPRLRLVIVPRHPQRFDEVAELVGKEGFELIRRSQAQGAAPGGQQKSKMLLPPVILGDTMGELRKFYSLASVVFVGRSLVDLGYRQHGSDMIEAAALAKPVIVGPYTTNFAEAMSRFTAAEAMFVVDDAEQLHESVSVLLSTPAQAAEMGRRAQAVVRQNQGATERHAQIILAQLKHHAFEAWPTVVGEDL